MQNDESYLYKEPQLYYCEKRNRLQGRLAMEAADVIELVSDRSACGVFGVFTVEESSQKLAVFCQIRV